MSLTNPKRGGNTGHATAERERKRREADERNEARRRRTTQEQETLLDARPGHSTRERMRLNGEGLTTIDRSKLVRRGRKAGLEKSEMKSMTDHSLALAVAAAERAGA